MSTILKLEIDRVAVRESVTSSMFSITTGENGYFTTTDIVKGLQIPFGRLREWIVRGYVKPSVPAAGPGKAARFSIDDICRIHIFRIILEFGIPRERAARILDSATE